MDIVTDRAIENIETARLVGRRIQSGDLPLIREMHSNPRVMATLGGLRTDEESQEFFAAHVERWQRDGYGPWMWYAKADGQFVGRGGLRKSIVEGTEETEVGYALLPEFWGQGLATEIAQASVQTAFMGLGLRDVVAFTLPTNLASRRVMEKCGFVFHRDIVWKDLPHVLYRRVASSACSTE
jgi:[ribosomal protein S5]-alanine N-acetyltransferase